MLQKASRLGGEGMIYFFLDRLELLLELDRC